MRMCLIFRGGLRAHEMRRREILAVALVHVHFNHWASDTKTSYEDSLACRDFQQFSEISETCRGSPLWGLS
jgi:hypothetical protein